jgi:hypothetical protein
MNFRNILRKVFLSIALGAHPVLGVGMSEEKIDELLHAMNQTRVEMTIDDDLEKIGLQELLDMSNKKQPDER